MTDNLDTIVCLDSTYNVVKKLRPVSEDRTQVYESAFLFTLLTKDRFSKKGIPISFMICSNESQYSIAYWLNWFNNNCGFRKNGFMVDCSVVEHAGIKAIWERNLKAKGKVYFVDGQIKKYGAYGCVEHFII
ncbi:hypothetical protein BGX20_000182 [Mortierella sp. AD010]|nr:hypothetical protein BGX20_000182 [Mortierella sp. AD010]